MRVCSSDGDPSANLPSTMLPHLSAGRSAEPDLQILRSRDKTGLEKKTAGLAQVARLFWSK
jgi:hypothetical protein